MSGQGSVSRALGAAIAVEQRGRLRGQGLGCPIPSGRQAAVIARMDRRNEIANRPGAMVLPQLYSAGYAPGVPAGQVAGGYCYMCWAGAAWAVARLRPLRHVSFLSAWAGPGAGAQKAYKGMTSPSTSVAENIGRLIGHDRDAQLGVGRNARRLARLARASQGVHYFAESCFADARRGGIQIGDFLGIESRCVGPRARSPAPIMGLFSVASLAIR